MFHSRGLLEEAIARGGSHCWQNTQTPQGEAPSQNSSPEVPQSEATEHHSTLLLRLYTEKNPPAPQIGVMCLRMRIGESLCEIKLHIMLSDYF